MPKFFLSNYASWPNYDRKHMNHRCNYRSRRNCRRWFGSHSWQQKLIAAGQYSGYGNPGKSPEHQRPSWVSSYQNVTHNPYKYTRKLASSTFRVLCSSYFISLAGLLQEEKNSHDLHRSVYKMVAVIKESQHKNQLNRGIHDRRKLIEIENEQVYYRQQQ